MISNTGKSMYKVFSAYFFIDEDEFRNFIVWLEDQKIRHYKIEDRAGLRNIKSSDWTKAYKSVRSSFTVCYIQV